MKIFNSRNMLAGMLICASCLDAMAQSTIPNIPAKQDFGGEPVTHLDKFVPTVGDYTLETEGKANVVINIAFSGITYTPESDATVRFVQTGDKVYVFENATYTATLTPNPEYTFVSDNIIPNPSFESVAEELSSGRWQPTDWDTWDGGKPTWGGEIGQTNVRENATYRSDGTKSIIMHSNARYLMSPLATDGFKSNSYYLLTYDYWTSEGWNNGGVTYSILFGKERCAGDVLSLTSHTTEVSGTAKCSFATLFSTPSDVPSEVWMSLHREESKVDWLDNFSLRQITPKAMGLTGVTKAVYLSSGAYAPDNMVLPEGTYIDMTSRLANPSFSDGTITNDAPAGWTLATTPSPQSKISTGEKGGGVIAGGQNHWQLWSGSGGCTGRAYQTLSGLPNGRYTISAAISSSFSGTVKIYANKGAQTVTSGKAARYEASGTVYDGTLEVGLELATSGSPTIDMDDFTLHYHGMDIEGYKNVLETKKTEAARDTILMHLSTNPGYSNIDDYRTTLDVANALVDSTAATLIAVIEALDAVMNEYDAIIEAYTLLKTATDGLQTVLRSSKYPDKTEFNQLVNDSEAMYDSEEDQRANITAQVALLTKAQQTLNNYATLQTAIRTAKNLLNTNDYPGKTAFEAAIAKADEAYADPSGIDLAAVISALQIATNDYYNSQYTVEVQQQIVSWVDLSLSGSEKYVLRIDGKPYYGTNIQVRLDKLYGYEGWKDSDLEKVLKQAAADGFNTVSIPLFWREVEPEKNMFDWRILDKYLNWCKKYNLRMELLWFSWSSGGRVQYLWNYGGRKEPRTPDYVCSLDGKSEFNMLRTTWEYSLDWRDKNLMERERYVLNEVMNHVALWDANNGNPHTVIGVQLGNEARAHGGNSASAQEIIDYYHHVGAGVKKSKYVVWTRLNCVSYETSGRTSANENKRNNGGTNIDFVGIDIYGTNASKVKGNMDGQLGANGKNYRMIMEIDAKDSNSPIYQMAALAGDKAFDYYNFCVVDGNALYTNSGTTLVERSHITEVRNRNHMLNKANQDIALKSHGKGLFVYNYAGNNATDTGLEGIKFTPSSARSQAIALRRSSSEFVLLSTEGGTFTIPSSLGMEYAESGYYNDNGEWVKETDVTIADNTIAIGAAECIRISSSKTKHKVFTIGDSTMAKKASWTSERGWGMLFPLFVDTDMIEVSNHGLDGYSTKSFIDGGKWNAVLNQLSPGDYVLIQFGHNDAKSSSSLHTDTATTYRDNLRKFVTETRQKGAVPVLLTSIVRRSFDATGNIANTLGGYPAAARRVASELSVPLIDAEESTRYIENIAGLVGSRRFHQWEPPTEIDNTHLCNFGAYTVARIVAEGLREKVSLFPLNDTPQTLAGAGNSTLELACSLLAERVAEAKSLREKLDESASVGEFDAAISNIEQALTDKTATLARLDTLTRTLNAASLAARLGMPAPFDATFALGNPSFEEGAFWNDPMNSSTPMAWTLSAVLSNQDIQIKTGSAADGYYRFYIWDEPADIDFSQTVSLPVGTYTLRAALKGRGDMGVTWLYATTPSNTVDALAEGLTWDTWSTNDLSFSITEEAQLVRLGFKSTSPLILDNVRLLRLEDSPTSIDNDGAEKTLPISTTYNDLSGRHIAVPRFGQVYIVRETFADGTVRTHKRITE